jgi:hypothetical protein
MQDRSPSLFDVAGQVDNLLRRFDSLEYFRARVREAASEHVAHKRAAQKRESAWVAFLVENGTWEELKTTPTERPAGQDVFWWSFRFLGITRLPVPERPGPNASGQDWEAWVRAAEPFFRELQESGFPLGAHTKPDEKWYEYEFEVEAWLPKTLNEPEDVHAADTPLPVPKRTITLVGRYAGLAAVHDAHWRGSELIAPWGVNSRGDEDWPTPLLPPEDRDSSTASMWYRKQVMTAKDLGAKDAIAVASWLANVEADMAKAFPEKTQSTPAADVAEIADQVAARLEPAFAGLQEAKTPNVVDPPLGDRARLTLQVLLDEDAFTSDSRITTPDIATKAAGSETDPNQYKEVIADLKRLGFVETREGRGGGCWLTAHGKARAEKL